MQHAAGHVYKYYVYQFNVGSRRCFCAFANVPLKRTHYTDDLKCNSEYPPILSHAPSLSTVYTYTRDVPPSSPKVPSLQISSTCRVERCVQDADDYPVQRMLETPLGAVSILERDGLWALTHGSARFTASISSTTLSLSSHLRARGGK